MYENICQQYGVSDLEFVEVEPEPEIVGAQLAKLQHSPAKELASRYTSFVRGSWRTTSPDSPLARTGPKLKVLEKERNALAAVGPGPPGRCRLETTKVDLELCLAGILRAKNVLRDLTSSAEGSAEEADAQSRPNTKIAVKIREATFVAGILRNASANRSA